MGVFPECKSVYHMYVWYLQRPKEGVRSLGTGIMSLSELPDVDARCQIPILCRASLRSQVIPLSSYAMLCSFQMTSHTAIRC